MMDHLVGDLFRTDTTESTYASKSTSQQPHGRGQMSSVPVPDEVDGTTGEDRRWVLWWGIPRRQSPTRDFSREVLCLGEPVLDVLDGTDDVMSRR